jgi:hypothetical protein
MRLRYLLVFSLFVVRAYIARARFFGFCGVGCDFKHALFALALVFLLLGAPIPFN